MKSMILRLLLVLFGVLFCLCGPMILMPGSWFVTMAGWFVGSEIIDKFWSEDALFDYILRVSLVAYLWLGLILLVAASDPSKYWILIDLAIGELFLTSLVCLVAGIRHDLPLALYLGDTGFSLVAAVSLLVCRPKAKTQ